MKIMWNSNFSIHKYNFTKTTSLISFCIVYGCFCITIAELSSFNRLYVPQSLKYLLYGLLQKDFDP